MAKREYRGTLVGVSSLGPKSAKYKCTNRVSIVCQLKNYSNGEYATNGVAGKRMSTNGSKTSKAVVHVASTCFHRSLLSACAKLEQNYLVVCTILVMLILSLLLPNLSQKIHICNKMKEMQKVLDIMSTEVNRAEVACLTAADEVYLLQCSVRDNATETEITLMSYIYTHSFDVKKPINATTMMSEITT